MREDISVTFYEMPSNGDDVLTASTHMRGKFLWTTYEHTVPRVGEYIKHTQKLDPDFKEFKVRLYEVVGVVYSKVEGSVSDYVDVYLKEMNVSVY